MGIKTHQSAIIIAFMMKNVFNTTCIFLFSISYWLNYYTVSCIHLWLCPRLYDWITSCHDMIFNRHFISIQKNDCDIFLITILLTKKLLHTIRNFHTDIRVIVLNTEKNVFEVMNAKRKLTCLKLPKGFLILVNLAFSKTAMCRWTHSGHFENFK